MCVRSANILKFIYIILFLVTNIVARYVPNDEGHCVINRTQAEKSCASLDDYNLKDSLRSLISNAYYVKLKGALSRGLKNELGGKASRVAYKVKRNGEQANDMVKSKLAVMSKDLSVIDDEM